jgi:hypothetical protein
MTNRPPPVPPASRSPKGPGNQAEPPTSTDKERADPAPENLKEQDRQATSSRTRPTKATSRPADHREGPQPRSLPRCPGSSHQAATQPKPRRTKAWSSGQRQARRHERAWTTEPRHGEYRAQGDRDNGGAPGSDASHRTLCVGHLSDRRSRRTSRRMDCDDELMAFSGYLRGGLSMMKASGPIPFSTLPPASPRLRSGIPRALAATRRR